MSTATDQPPVSTRPGIRIDIIGIIGAILVGAIVLMLPTPQGLPPVGQRLAALFAGALILWITEAIPVAMTAVLTLGMQPILGINTLPVAITNFINTVFFFMLVMFA